MIKVENIEVWGFEHAVRGMRNPMNSWDKSDSVNCHEYGEDCDFCERNYSNCSKYYIGKNDLDLMRRLFKAGTEHRKYLRQVFVSMDITAPQYWFSEFDTYKVGTVANSTSKMHKLMAKPFELSDFSCEHVPAEAFDNIISDLNDVRETYLDFEKLMANGSILQRYSKKDVWYCLIQMLPESYNQRRTVTMNYENVFTIIKQRSGHKLDEWNDFVEILKTLPYVQEIMGDKDESS